MASHSSILAWRISRTREPGTLQSMGSDMTEVHVHTHGDFSYHCFFFFSFSSLIGSFMIDSHQGGTWDSPVGKPRGKTSSESP